MKIYAFVYNPMIEESGYITVSLHKTKEGTLKALDEHKAEMKREWTEKIKKSKEIYGEDFHKLRRGMSFGMWEDWDIEERELLD
jgi:hypothetical protein